MGCTNLQILDISNWNTQKINNLSHTFSNCISLQNLNLSNWDTHNIQNLAYCFAYSNRLWRNNLRIATWNVAKVNNFYGTFSGMGMGSMMNIFNLLNLSLFNWNTYVNTANLELMFAPASVWNQWAGGSICLNNFRFNNLMHINNIFGRTNNQYENVTIYVRDYFAKNLLTNLYPTTNFTIATEFTIENPNSITIMNNTTQIYKFPFYGSAPEIRDQDFITYFWHPGDEEDYPIGTNSTASISIDWDAQEIILSLDIKEEENKTLTYYVKGTDAPVRTFSIPIIVTPYISQYYSVEQLDCDYGFELDENNYYYPPLISLSSDQYSTWAVCKINFKTGTGKIIIDCLSYLTTSSLYSEYGVLSKIDTPLSLMSGSDDSSAIYKSFSGGTYNNYNIQSQTYTNIDENEHFIYIKFKRDYPTPKGGDFRFKVRFE